jgi:hypothetical protein
MLSQSNFSNRGQKLSAFLSALFLLLFIPYSLGSSYQYPILSNNVRSTTPAFNSSLDISLAPFCENESYLSVFVSKLGQPISGAEVKLYNYSQGRQLDSIVFTNSQGWAYFNPRPAGRYDIIATTSDNLSMGRIFFSIPPCLAPPSGASFKQEWLNLSSDVLIFSQHYPNEISREFYLTKLANSQIATKILIKSTVVGDGRELFLVEQIPASLALSPRSIGFDLDYPYNISFGNTAELEWKLKIRGVQQIERSYIIMRPINEEIARLWDAPKLRSSNASSLQPSSNFTNNSSITPSLNSSSNQSQLKLPALSYMSVGAFLVFVIFFVAAVFIAKNIAERARK